MSSKDSISIMERVIIMLFGVGVVMLGLYPLSRDYGSIGKFFKTKAAQVTEKFGDIGNEVSRARLSDERAEPRNTKKAFQSEEPKKNKKDIIDNKDREELDTLIDKVWK